MEISRLFPLEKKAISGLFPRISGLFLGNSPDISGLFLIDRYCPKILGHMSKAKILPRFFVLILAINLMFLKPIIHSTHTKGKLPTTCKIYFFFRKA